MFIVAYFILAVKEVLSILLTILMVLVIIRALLSWVNPDPYNPIVRFIHNVTEPVLYQVRKRIPVVYGGLDLSPIIVFLLIVFLQKFLIASLDTVAHRLLQ
jgi:YggT family protein